MSESMVLPMTISQSRLGCPTYSGLEVGYIESCFSGVQDFPKQHSVYIHWHRILGQSFFCLERRCDHPGINPVRNHVDDRDNKK